MYSKTEELIHEYSSRENDKLEAAIKQIAVGDKEALTEVFQLTKIAVYGFVLSLMKNKEEAEDVFQEVYIKIFENANSYKAQGKPMAWIITIAKNLCYMRFRKMKDTTELEKEELWTENENIEERILLAAAFKQISDEERSIVMLHVLSGLKHREIAKILELPLPTVLSKYHRAIRKLKRILEEN